MTQEEYEAGPDDFGWYWFKKTKKAEAVIVYISEEGIATALDSSGDSYELDDLVGLWCAAEPNI